MQSPPNRKEVKKKYEKIVSENDVYVAWGSRQKQTPPP
jgi:hypothetical protein